MVINVFFSGCFLEFPQVFLGLSLWWPSLPLVFLWDYVLSDSCLGRQSSITMSGGTQLFRGLSGGSGEISARLAALDQALYSLEDVECSGDGISGVIDENRGSNKGSPVLVRIFFRALQESHSNKNEKHKLL